MGQAVFPLINRLEPRLRARSPLNLAHLVHPPLLHGVALFSIFRQLSFGRLGELASRREPSGLRAQFSHHASDRLHDRGESLRRLGKIDIEIG